MSSLKLVEKGHPLGLSFGYLTGKLKVLPVSLVHFGKEAV